MTKPVRYTKHAEAVLVERNLEKTWVERTVREPEWRTGDPGSSDAERRFRTIPERQDRVMRVICVENQLEIRIVSAFLDRRARRPQ
ncbi:MAG: DUF4258 domain-containing protein [Hoeflea sp.]|nr:DUF4258 domain-containing protein [Alphaproteobacteria bacterium]MBV1725453.1 DUF4258 domain-containing protein [Hoeflea sp.]MBU4544806.1 DUF4258 domain-containing protein [Alphaproteobacteria bacterium]MBU4551448.1 DUF4258 domain-containing protein [Alphaproteobacteria bacterium]MBV1759501.1 DUF4258 domain-containing protein [Hoeflea sp.]